MASDQRAVDLIERKRFGDELDDEEIRTLIDGFVAGDVGEGQMGAFLMAGVIHGFSASEAAAMTRAMVASGTTLDLSSVEGLTIDKHSTGGVGDGTTFLVGPLLAAAGATVVKLSGRGLGHTGGTLDKLESVPGVRVDLSDDEIVSIAADVGCVVAAQSSQLVPADGAIYALRDETATVDSVALIAASVMSKKLAAGADTIVLDVKCGDGAFMRTADEARALADLCVRLGNEAGRRTMALITDMDQPLGRAVGNALEIAEAVELLSAPPQGRLAEVALALASLALSEGRLRADDAGGGLDEVRAELEDLWRDGAALERLSEMIRAQGGDGHVVDDPRSVLPSAAVVRDVVTTKGGVCTAVPAREIGRLAARLGAGRARKGEAVDHAVGIVLGVEVGDRCEPGDVVATVHAAGDAAAEEAVQRLRDLLVFGEAADHVAPILDRVRPG